MNDIIDNIFAFGFVAIIGIMMFVLISLPTTLAYYLKQWLTKKGYRFVGIILFIIVPIWTAYEIYFAIYPPESFYIFEFEYHTGLVLPNSVEFIAKDASYPDIHGDYWSAAVVRLSTEDFNQLKNHFFEQPRMQLDTTTHGIGIGTDFVDLTSDLKLSTIDLTFVSTRWWFKVAFLNDGRTLIFEQFSW